MKRRNFILGVFVAVVALVVARQLASRDESKQAKNFAHAPEGTPYPTNSPSAPQPHPQSREERIQTVYRAIEGTNRPINFWGKVIDQDGHSISGVAIKYSYSIEHGNLMGVAWGVAENKQGSTMTDDAGLFSIIGLKGHYLAVESLTKDGYRYNARKADDYDYYGATSAGKFTPDSNSPQVFVMVSNETLKPIISVGGDFGKMAKVSADGTPLKWDLWHGRQDANGELQIIFKRQPVILSQGKSFVNWNAQIGVINGGIVQAPPDASIRRAPETGYTAVVEYPKQQQKRGVGGRAFYIKTANGNYGWVQVELYPEDEGASVRCLIKDTMNPKPGSTIVE